MTKQYFMACLVTVLLAIPALLNAATAIALAEPEKKRVAQGEIVVREIAAAGGKGRLFEAIGLIKASRNNVLMVLKDYEKYPEFMPNVSRVEIVEQKGNAAVLNYTLTLPLGKIKKYRLKISESAPEKQVSLLEWQIQPWPELKRAETITDTTGYWRIEEQSENKSLILYHVYTDPGPIPFGLGWIVDVLSKDSVPKALSQTKKRTEKLSRLKPLNRGPEPQK
jgi:ribosome-associated toxin RatA of RatAB toxin-antitoxin module